MAERKVAGRGETRKRLVSAAIRLLQRSGTHGMGLQELLAESGAPRGSLYFHFPGGKDELVREALREVAAATDAWLREALGEGRSAADAFAAFLAGYEELLLRSAFSQGCPVGAVTLDLGSEGDRLRAACDWALTGWVALLAERLRLEGRDAEQAEALALTAVAALEGALVVSRARRSSEPLRAVSAQVRLLLDPSSSHRHAAGG